jgi:hypothetical protein
MGIDLRLAVLALQTPYERMAWVSARDRSLWSVVTVDTRLSTPSDRTWPILYFPQLPRSIERGLPDPSEGRFLKTGLPFSIR